MKFHPIRPIHQFFATAPVSCPYLSGGAERKLVVELGGPDGEALFADLSRAGFRRSHGFAYRPACRGCRKCVPVRIHVEAFQPTRSLRRVARRNEDLHYAVLPARATREQYRLFLAYQRQRHGSSDMAEMSFADYRDMVEDSPVQTWLVETRDVEGTLVGGLLVDRTADALSAAYSFFDPAQPRRSERRQRRQEAERGEAGERIPARPTGAIKVHPCFHCVAANAPQAEWMQGVTRQARIVLR